MRLHLLFMALALLIVGCDRSHAPKSTSVSIKSIYWSDGDSGRITLLDDSTLKFRIDDWDAPETGGVGAAIGGAKCEEERELGFKSKEFMVLNSKENASFTHNDEYDRHKRLLIRIFTNGEDLIEKAKEAGHIRSWAHEGAKELEPRPDWCGIREN